MSHGFTFSSKTVTTLSVATALLLSLSACATAPRANLPESGPTGQLAPAGLTVHGVPEATPRSAPTNTVVPDLALLIGDSQAGGAAGVPAAKTWPHQGLNKAGYKVWFVGAGGTGFVAATPRARNYLNALDRGDWKLPRDNPALVVVEGGGNDAGQNRSVAAVTANAEKLVAKLKVRYPKSKIIMLGTISMKESPSTSRRWAVDRALSASARKLQVPFIDPAGWVSTYGVEQKLADKVHLSQAGHDVIGGVLDKALIKAGYGRSGAITAGTITK